ncbi:GTP cyclohydrolase II [Monoraphidium neglectum]|uniref:GTP cyclohydrolase II n=1 Tax=Monoraphidium neglectum TaxID=145388 RepID=A0A0D2LNR3_9CHLO|nr:GTP cyclohydrolase II [Monoraphidium neglectum]KIZ07919.1 GTP cyclohydrolase II [Monoraphidium neglectum]|eukprot:XP_013906938.1 GTP cyclohydrolase II [Monoraphidium neglectum]
MMLTKLQTPSCRVATNKSVRAHGAGCPCCAGRSRSVRVSAAAPSAPGAQKDGLVRLIDEDKVRTVHIAETMLPTRHGNFRLRGYKHSTDGGKTFAEPTAIICGKVEGCEEVVLRVHDACFTSEVLGSLKCDCAEQLQMSMEYIHANAPGIVIYLWQEGRGIGLANKIAAYKLQEQGLDTVDANRALGLPDDSREYTSVRNILAELGVKSVRLMTNNPRKINVLTALGVKVTGRVPCQIQAGNHNKGYLEAKTMRMDHMIDNSYWTLDEAPVAPAQAE